MNFKKFVTLYIKKYINGMDKTCITKDGIEYVFSHFERNVQIAELLCVKLSYIMKVNMVCRGTFKATKGMAQFIEQYNFRIIPLTQEEIDEVLKKRHENKIATSSKWWKNKRQQPDYTEYRRREGVKPRVKREKVEKKERIVKEKKEKVVRQKKEKVVKETKIVKPTPIRVTAKTLKEMLLRCNGENTPELWNAYYSVAQRLSKKFFRNGSTMIDDMISEAVLCAAMYFVRNAKPEYNLFAYLTEICKRSFAASFNKFNLYGKVTLDAMFEKI